MTSTATITDAKRAPSTVALREAARRSGASDSADGLVAYLHCRGMRDQIDSGTKQVDLAVFDLGSCALDIPEVLLLESGRLR